MKEKIEYIKNGEVVLINTCGKFIYETNVFVYYKKYFALVNTAMYSSYTEIEGVVKSFWKTPHIQICSELYSAPEKWLQDNQFKRYMKPKKVLKIKLKK